MYVLRTTIIVISGFLLTLVGMSSLVHAQANPEFIYTRNSDIDFNISNVSRAQYDDYNMKTNLCFDYNPPNFGRYEVQLTMQLKDKNNPSIVKEELIGASVDALITTPANARCDSRNLRRLTANPSFNIPPEDRWEEECPQIKVKVVTTGNWKPYPQEDVAYIGREFLCPNGVPTTAPRTPTAAPTTAPEATSTPTPPLASNAITGRITVFSCTEPENVTISYCDDTAGNNCNDISVSTSTANQAVWLDDDTNERTFIYKYKITQDKAGKSLDPSKKYMIYNANARVDNYINDQMSTVPSAREDKKEVSVPGTRDLTVFAKAQTCGCFFHATAHVRDADTGEITTALDEQQVPGKSLTFGSANDHQIIVRGDAPVSPFTNGVLDVNQDLTNILKFSDNVGGWTGYGVDGTAYVRLYAPGYSVVKQRCQTTRESEVLSCPGNTLEYQQTFTDEKNFVGFRVACGVGVSYDWYVRKNPGGASTEIYSVTKPANVDINKDGFINTADLVACIDEWGQKEANLVCDINKDSSVDALDLSLVTSLQGTEVQQE